MCASDDSEPSHCSVRGSARGTCAEQGPWNGSVGGRGGQGEAVTQGLRLEQQWPLAE